MRKGLFYVFLLTLVVLGTGAIFAFSDEEKPDRRRGRRGVSFEAPHLLMIGLDGANWDVIDPLIDAGRMPHLAELKAGGTWADLKTLPVMVSPRIWTTIATGKLPAQHGIRGFTVEHHETGKRVPVNRSARKVKAFWNILGDFGRTVGVVGWWATWPAETVNGYLVSSYLPHDSSIQKGQLVSELPGQTYPAGLARALAEFVVSYEDLGEVELSRFFPSGFQEDKIAVEALRWALAADETYRSVTLRMLETRKQPDVLSVYFGGTDVVAHKFWKYREPEKFESVDPVEVALYKDTINLYYEYVDEILGELLSRIAPDTSIIVLSDHGLGPGKPGSGERMNGTHRRNGMLLLHGRPFQEGRQLPRAHVLDVLPTILTTIGVPLARDLEGRVLRKSYRRGYLQNVKTRRVRSYESGDPVESAPIQSSPFDEEMIDRLKATGYLQ